MNNVNEVYDLIRSKKLVYAYFVNKNSLSGGKFYIISYDKQNNKYNVHYNSLNKLNKNIPLYIKTNLARDSYDNLKIVQKVSEKVKKGYELVELQEGETLFTPEKEKPVKKTNTKTSSEIVEELF